LATAALRGEQEMRLRVPKGETLRLFESIRVSPLRFSPGGLGGGGFYEIEVGPADDAPEHLAFVFGGTSDLFGKAMFIQKLGEPGHWIYRRRGQRAQTEWVTEAQDVTRNYLRANLERMDLFR